jgi:predicted transcriptional regulator
MEDDGNLCLLCARMRSIKYMMDSIEAMDELGEYLDDDLTEAFNALDDALSTHRHYRGDNCAEELDLYEWQKTDAENGIA